MIKIAVVVPVYNEADVIERLLEALRHQTRSADQIIIVDNGSDDNSVVCVRQFAAAHSEIPISIVAEPYKGTGAACDTGFRYAIQQGYTAMARTDADSVPEPEWLAELTEAAKCYPNAILFGGRLVPVNDKWRRTGDSLLLPVGLGIIRYGLMFRNGSRAYMRLAIGSNMMIRSDAYIDVGGFNRSGIDDADEDIVLSASVYRAYGRRAIRGVPNARVAVSMRRPRAQGAWQTLLRHISHRYRRQQDMHDVR